MHTCKNQSGQATTEYLVILIIVMVMLGVGLSGSPSVITEFLDAIRAAFERFSSFLSLPM